MGKTDTGKNTLFPILIIIWMAIALGLRVWGSSWGLPYPYHPDEDKIVSHALAFGSGDLNPHYFGWPSLQMYVMFFIYGCYFVGGWLLDWFAHPNDFIGAVAVDPSHLYLLGRWLSALLGSLTVGLTYTVGKRLYGREVGLVAAVFLAVNYLHVKDSHYITPDVPAAFMVMAAFWFAVRIAQQAPLMHYVGAGILSGLAISVKYPAFLIAFSVLTAHLIAARNQSTVKLFCGRAWLGAALIPAAFVAGTPYSLLDLDNFLIDLWHQKMQVTSPLPLLDRLRITLLDNPLPALGVGIYSLTFAGTALCLYRRNWTDLLLLSFPLTYVAFLLFTGGLQYRYLMPLLPFFCLLAAVFLAGLGELLSRLPIVSRAPMRAFMIAAIAVLVFQPLAYSITLDHSLSRLDTRTEARAWVERNIPAGARIAVEAYGPLLLPLETPPPDEGSTTASVQEWLKHKDRIIEQDVYSRLKRSRLGENWKEYKDLTKRAREEAYGNHPHYIVFKLRAIPSMWAVLLNRGRVEEDEIKNHPEYGYFFDPKRFLAENKIEYVIVSSATQTHGRLEEILQREGRLLHRVEKEVSTEWSGRLPFYSFHNPTLEIYRLKSHYS